MRPAAQQNMTDPLHLRRFFLHHDIPPGRKQCGQGSSQGQRTGKGQISCQGCQPAFVGYRESVDLYPGFIQVGSGFHVVDVCFQPLYAFQQPVHDLPACRQLPVPGFECTGKQPGHQHKSLIHRRIRRILRLFRIQNGKPARQHGRTELFLFSFFDQSAAVTEFIPGGRICQHRRYCQGLLRFLFPIPEIFDFSFVRHSQGDSSCALQGTAPAQGQDHCAAGFPAQSDPAFHGLERGIRQDLSHIFPGNSMLFQQYPDFLQQTVFHWSVTVHQQDLLSLQQQWQLLQGTRTCYKLRFIILCHCFPPWCPPAVADG